MRANVLENSAVTRWTFPDNPSPSAVIQQLSAELGLPSVVAKILAARGMETPEKAGRFLFPKIQELCDPFLLPGMKTAVEHLVSAMSRWRSVWIVRERR